MIYLLERRKGSHFTVTGLVVVAASEGHARELASQVQQAPREEWTFDGRFDRESWEQNNQCASKEDAVWLDSEKTTCTGPSSWIDLRMYYEGEQVEGPRGSFIATKKIPPGGWAKVIGLHVWRRTGKVYSWGDEKRQALIAGINADFAAQYEAWKTSQKV